MTGMPSKPSAQQFLGDLEQTWARQLKSVSLVAEVRMPQGHAEQALSLIAGRYRHLMAGDDELGARQLLRRWPSVQVVAMVQLATDHYDRNNFWTPFCDRTGLANDGDLQRVWGSVFVENLGRVGLPTFDNIPDSGTRYVGRILMHCGIPTYCLPDFFRLIASRRKDDHSLTGTSFVADATVDAEQDRLHVDKPVSRFIRYGGDFAVDVADRCFDLIDDVLAGGDGARALLPSRFAQVAVELTRDRAFEELRRRKGGVVEDDRSGSPSLVLDPYGRGVLVRLPASSDAPDGEATWQVTIDGQREYVRSRALWPGSKEPAPATDFPVSRPSRAALVKLGYRADGPVSVVPIVDDSDPILFFDDQGDKLPSTVALPSAPVWLLYPETGGLGAVSFEGDHRVIAAGTMPAGWSGWRTELVDLARVRSLSLGASGKPHPVRGTQSARVSTGSPVEGLRTPYGSNVYSERPRIELPDLGGDELAWEVSIADGRGQVLVREQVHGSGEASSLWDKLPTPLLGAFRVQIRGPWGRGATRSLVLAEGVSADFRPSWRRFGRGGLRPSEVEIRTRGGISVDRRTIALGPSMRAAPVVLGRQGVAETFIVTPPHMTVSYETAASAGRERVQPASLETETLVDEPGKLLVRLGHDVEPQLHVLCGGSSVQVVRPGARAAHGVYQFDLARIVETVRQRGAATLALDPGGDVVVASIRPRQLASAATVADGVINLEGSRDISGLTAAVYALRAPWRGPRACSVTDGRIELPAEYREAGPMLVSLYIDDPWVPVVPAAWPVGSGAMVANASGSLLSDDHDETALSAFLAGATSPPLNLSDLSRVWVVLDLVDSLGLAERAQVVRTHCQDQLQSQPMIAMASLADAGLAPESAPAVLAASGVLPRARPGEVLYQAQWPASPAAAVLALPSAIDAGDSKALEAAADFCGSTVNDLLAGKADPHRIAGRLDASADMYAAMSTRAREALRAAAAFVPKAMLDADTRSESAMRLVERNRDSRAKLTRDGSAPLLREAQSYLQKVDDKRFYWAVQARTHPTVTGGWQALSALSLAIALVSRLTARGQVDALSWLDRRTKYWAALALVAPEITNVDLVLAELLCLGAHEPIAPKDEG